MKYFKDENNDIFGFDDQQVAAGLVAGNLVEIAIDSLDILLAPTPAYIAQSRKTQINERLKAIDLESLRPLRAVANQTATAFDNNKLAALNNEAETLRAELATL
ncbi:hypothetical protein CYQ88_10815 [Hydrogenovibrio sp. SC-1]|uniref:hypothetical protein n=1 Tax=Hydrogenovibrio sp. SC-1 TaxID=2065820 RepID=UPI000C7B1738|nr:hypothetical protein [Hydrogenovibrio sp. SC-1]PLA73506.1 hypothetical protein CYQ88_10815 [Hydrogenovibrio sp. SC-1]